MTKCLIREEAVSKRFLHTADFEVKEADPHSGAGAMPASYWSKGDILKLLRED
jgi:hypothetical protein